MTSSAKTVMSAGLKDVANNTPLLDHPSFSDPSRLAPEDAFFAHSPPHRHREISQDGASDTAVVDERPGISRPGVSARRRREKERGRSGSRRRKGTWKKLLWVKQNCMTRNFNLYTDCSIELNSDCFKTPIITQTHRLSFRTSSVILDSSHTISGH